MYKQTQWLALDIWVLSHYWEFLSTVNEEPLCHVDNWCTHFLENLTESARCPTFMHLPSNQWSSCKIPCSTFQFSAFPCAIQFFQRALLFLLNDFWMWVLPSFVTRITIPGGNFHLRGLCEYELISLLIIGKLTVLLFFTKSQIVQHGYLMRFS